MITLQADPLIEWDETKDFNSQTTECQQWVAENLLSNAAVVVNESATRADAVTWERIKSQAYSNGTFELKIERSYPSLEDCANPTATWTLITL